MNQIKISPEIKIDSPEGQSLSSDTVKESTQELPKKNSFEEVLKKISELRKGKTFATHNETSNFHSDLSGKKDSEIEELISKNKDFNIININNENPEKVATGKRIEDKDVEEKLDILKVENAINPELQSIFLGPNTQIITAKEIESNTEQLIAYAKKAGLNENAISILLKSTAKKEFSSEEIKFNKTEFSNLTDNVGPNSSTKRHNNLSHSKGIQPKQLLPQDLIINNNLKSRPISEKINAPSSTKKLNIELNDEIDPDNSKNFKMLMKAKDENFLEKLIAKKQEEEKAPNLNKIDRLQSIELGTRASQFISSVLTIRNSEISQSSKISEIEQSLYSQSSVTFANKFESSTSGGHQQDTSKEKQSEQIQLKRQEQFQQMAQRLGETLAKRITEQISKGAWRVQIALRPASLGSIEISLNLRGKEIEASFHASQAFTRELLAESLPKLKETLEKSGMNVADMNIAGQNESKSGNNSTNEDEKDKDIKIDEIKTNIKDEEKPKDSILSTDQSGGLNILV